MTLLFQTAGVPDRSQIEMLVRQVDASCVVEELPMHRQPTYRITTQTGSYLIHCGQGVHSLVQRWQNNMLSEQTLLPDAKYGPLVQSAINGQSWMEILADDISVNSTGNAVEAEFLRLSGSCWVPTTLQFGTQTSCIRRRWRFLTRLDRGIRFAMERSNRLSTIWTTRQILWQPQDSSVNGICWRHGSLQNL